MNSDQKNALMAVVLSGVVLFSWQTFFAPKPVPQAALTTTTKGQSNVVLPSANTTTASANPVVAQNFELKAEAFGVDFNNTLQVSKMTHNKSKLSLLEISGSENPVQFYVLRNNFAEPLNLQVTAKESNKITAVDNRLGVTANISLSNNNRLNISLKSQNPERYRLEFRAVKEQKNGFQRSFKIFTSELNTEKVDKEHIGEGTAKWFGLDYDHHLFAAIMQEKSNVKYVMHENGVIDVDFSDGVKDFQTGLLLSEKNFDYLKEQGDKLELAVDFGVLGLIAVPILRGLQFFYRYFPNYGIAIILLTLLVRMITFPLQIKSFKSMKKMQKIQPELAKIKEKYKADPQKVQKETMELFKREGANPLGGCLPLLLQMPVFFAFYKVLHEAVELVGAPFMLWIHDLAQKDPFYVLPVLMTASMFFQQKLTPATNVDPTQQKIMMFMPLIFGFVMKDLPSGLVLYIFVSTLFGMAQQLLVYRLSE